MKQFLRRIALTSAAIFIAVASVNIGGAAQVFAAGNPPANRPGNNGTFKVHEFGTLSGTESNDPKVCVFNFEAFDLDANQTGSVTIEGQGATNLATPVVIPLSTDALGNGQTLPYVNATGSPYVLQNGHYKATLDNKFGTDKGNKAKSKVFKVECAAPALIKVTPTAPTMVESCGTASDTYTIPTTANVTYRIGNQAVMANTYTGSGTVAITATANAGYVLEGTASWSFTFASTPCNVTVTPATPTKIDLCGTTNDTYTIPETTGVKYYVNGIEKAAGTYTGSGFVAITAGPAALNYILQGTKLWVFIYTNLPCVAVATPPAKNDICGRDDDTYTIPSATGVRYFVNGVERAAGTYKAPSTVKIVAVAKSGYVLDLSKQVIWIFTFTNKACPQPCHGAISLRFFGRHDRHDDVDCVPVQVKTAAPTFADECGTTTDSYKIPSTAGVVYKANGVTVSAGTHYPSGSVAITAYPADNGYVIAKGQTTSWTFDFTDKKCPVEDISVMAECNAQGVLVKISNDGDADGAVYLNNTSVAVAINETKEILVPTVLFKASVKVTSADMRTVLLEDTYDCTPGRGAAGDHPTPTTTVTQTSDFTSSTPDELPSTGAGSWKLLFAGIVLAMMTYGTVYYLQGRRQLSANE